MHSFWKFYSFHRWSTSPWNGYFFNVLSHRPSTSSTAILRKSEFFCGGLWICEAFFADFAEDSFTLPEQLSQQNRDICQDRPCPAPAIALKAFARKYEAKYFDGLGQAEIKAGMKPPHVALWDWCHDGWWSVSTFRHCATLHSGLYFLMKIFWRKPNHTILSHNNALFASASSSRPPHVPKLNPETATLKRHSVSLEVQSYKLLVFVH